MGTVFTNQTAKTVPVTVMIRPGDVYYIIDRKTKKIVKTITYDDIKQRVV